MAMENTHLALYRKYRPRTFEEVVGQEHITKTLANQILADKISHAYLFTGSRGTGKTSVAKIFAKAVNCQNNTTGSPCGECEVCKRLSAENDINIIEIDAASNNRVDDIRELREKVKFAPAEAERDIASAATAALPTTATTSSFEEEKAAPYIYTKFSENSRIISPRGQNKKNCHVCTHRV